MTKRIARSGPLACALLLCALGGCSERAVATGDSEAFTLTARHLEANRVVARVTEDNDEIGLFGVAGVVEADGGYLVSDARNRRLVLLDQELGFVRVVGGGGEGPGEYKMPAKLERTPEHIVVFDEGNGRVSFLAHDGSFLESLQAPGNPVDIAVHPEHGVLAVTDGFEGYYLAKVSESASRAWAPIPPQLLSARASILLPTDVVAVTPDGAVHVLDTQELVLVSYDSDGVLLGTVAFPEPVRRELIDFRTELTEAFGGPDRVFSVSSVSDLVALPDGRLLALVHFQSSIGMVLDLETREAIPLTPPPAKEWEWLRGGSAALFDGVRLVITILTEVSVIDFRMVDG